MTLRKGIYIVPTDHWYIERTVWLIAGVVLLTGTLLAAFVQPLFVLLVVLTGIASIAVSLDSVVDDATDGRRSSLVINRLRGSLGAHPRRLGFPRRP